MLTEIFLEQHIALIIENTPYSCFRIEKLKPKVFPKSPFLRHFWGLESAEIALNPLKWPLKWGKCPCISLESHLTTFLLKHVQKSKFGDGFWMINHPITLGFSYFIIIFFLLFPFLFSYLFAEAVGFFSVQEFLRKRYYRHGQVKGGKGNSPLSFLLEFQNVFLHISSFQVPASSKTCGSGRKSSLLHALSLLFSIPDTYAVSFHNYSGACLLW